MQTNELRLFSSQLAGSVEYTDCKEARLPTTTDKCPGYDIKPFNGKAPTVEL